MDDDASLVRQARCGNREAYGRLVDRYAASVHALCRAWVVRLDVVEDLGQETFLCGLRDIASLLRPERFGPWLLGIARNRCRIWLRDRENGQVPFSAFARNGNGLSPVIDRADPANPAQADELDELMVRLLGLPPEFREILLLYYAGDVTYQQLADRLEVSTATVNARLTRARQMLRQSMTDREDSPVRA